MYVQVYSQIYSFEHVLPGEIGMYGVVAHRPRSLLQGRDTLVQPVGDSESVLEDGLHFDLRGSFWKEVKFVTSPPWWLNGIRPREITQIETQIDASHADLTGVQPQIHVWMERLGEREMVWVFAVHFVLER